LIKPDNKSQTGHNAEEFKDKLTKKIAKGGSISFLGQFGGKLTKFLFQILLTRVLGAASYGLFSLGYAALNTSSTFSRFGLHHALVRFGSVFRGKKEKSKLKGIITLAFLLSFLISIVVGATLYFSADFINTHLFQKDGLSRVLQLFALSLPFYTLMIMSSFTARAFRRIDYEVAIRYIFHPISLIIITGLVFILGNGLFGVLYAFLASSVLSTLFGVYLVFRLFPDIFTLLKPEFEFSQTVVYSVTVLLVGFSNILLTQVDRFMVGAFGTATDVGIYNAARIMSTQVVIFLASANAIFSPIISDLFDQDQMDQLRHLVKMTGKWIFSLTFPACLIIFLFSKDLMGLFGSGFRAGSWSLISLTIGQLLGASVGSMGFFLMMSNKERVEMINTTVLGLLNIAFNYFLIRSYGILGAAAATAISIGLVNLLRLAEVYLFFDIHPYKSSYWKPLVSGLAGVGLWTVLRWLTGSQLPWIVGVGVFSITYSALYLIFGLDEEEKTVIRAVAKKLTG